MHRGGNRSITRARRCAAGGGWSSRRSFRRQIASLRRYYRDLIGEGFIRFADPDDPIVFLPAANR